MNKCLPVTVLLSAYNAESWINTCIDSIISQTFKNFEFLIINDGSTDSTEEILRQRKRDDDRIVVVDKPNSGLANSLNLGISLAKGTWIARIDADDTAREDRLARQFELTKRLSLVGYIGSGCHTLDCAGNILQTTLYPSGDSALKKLLLKCKRFPPHSSAFYNRELAQNLGGYRSRIKRCEDTDLWLRLSRNTRFASVREPLVSLLHHEGQISAVYFYDMIVDSFIALTSYALTASNHSDPVLADEYTFDRFRHFISTALEATSYSSKVKQYRSHAKTLRQHLRQRAALPALSSLMDFVHSYLTLPRYALDRRRMAEIFARQWTSLAGVLPKN